MNPSLESTFNALVDRRYGILLQAGVPEGEAFELAAEQAAENLRKRVFVAVPVAEAA